VVNDGETTASENVSIVAGDTPGASTNVSLDGGEAQVITLTTNFTDQGLQEGIQVATEDPDEAPVLAGDVQVTSALRVSDIRVEPRFGATVGDDVTIDVDVTNRGPVVNDTELDRNITLDIGGDRIGNVRINRSAFAGNDRYDQGETHTLTFAPNVLNPVDQPGLVTLAADGIDGGSVSVSRRPVDLSLTISGEETVGEEVTFDVTADGEPVDATIQLPDRQLDINGTRDVTFNESIEGQVTAAKAANSTAFFRSDTGFISVAEPADIVVTNAEVNETQLFSGQRVGVTAVVRNVGGTAGSEQLNLTETNSGTVLANTTPNLAPGERREIEFTPELNETRIQTFAVDGTSAGSVFVDRAVAITETNAPSAADRTKEFNVSVTVEDRVDDGIEGSRNVTIIVGGKSSEANITPSDGGSTTRNFTFNITDDVDTVDAAIQAGDDGAPAEIGTIDLSRSIVGLELTTTPDPADVTVGEQITFAVNRTDTESDADATVSVAGQTLSTGDDGQVNTTIPVAGNFTATASKGGDISTGFTSDSASVTVTDPINVTLSNNFTSVQAAPEQGDARSGRTQTEDVTINNTGGREIAVSGFGFTGPDADQYRIDSDIPRSVAANDQIKVAIAFEPTVRRNTDATLRLRTDTPSNPVRTRTLNGTGTSPDVEVNTTTLEFGESLPTDAQVNETINVTNEGNVPLSVTPGSPEAAFSVTPGSTTIQPGNSQEYRVEFDPASTSPQTFGDVLQLSTNDTFDETVSVGLFATTSQAELTVRPASLDANELPVDDTATFDVLVSNTGTEPIKRINTTNETTSNGLVVSSGDDPTVRDLAPGSQELLDLELNQTQNASSSSANLTFVPSNDDVSNRTIQFDATPTAPGLSLTPFVDDSRDSNETDFGGVPTGGTVTDSFAVTNDGDATLEITNLRIDGPAGTPFSLPGTSGSVTVPPGEQRSITVQFNPQTTGTFADSEVVFEWNNASTDGTTTVRADLAGRGVETAIAGSTSTVDFGTTGSGATESGTLRVTNDGNTAFTIDRVSIDGSDPGQFDAAGSAVDTTLDPDENETIDIDYSPAEAAAHTAEITVSASNETTRETSNFTATLQGEATPPEVQLDDTSLEFGFVNSEADVSTTESVRVTNEGRPSTTLRILDASTSGDDAFNVSTEPDQAGESVVVEFDPQSDDTGDELEGTLTIETNDPDDSVVTVPLQGVATAPDPTPNRLTVGFGEVSTDAESDTVVVGITNDGGAPANVTGVSVTDTSNFTLVSGFNETLVPGETGAVAVRASPTDGVRTSANLTVTTAGPNTVPNVELVSTGVTPVASVSNPIDGDFGEIGRSSSTVRTISVRNNGEATLALRDIGASGEAFRVIGAQQRITLAPDEATDIGVAFSPTAANESFEGTLSIETNDDDRGRITRPLTGTGGTANASINESAADFGAVGLDSTESIGLELTNDDDGVGRLNVTSVTVSGADASAFEVSNLGTPSIDPGGSETFTVSASPTVARSLSAQLTIGTGQGASDVTVSLGATGTAPDFEVSSQQVSFDRTRLGATSAETLELRNTGNSPLDVRDVLVSGADSDQFGISTDSTVIPPDESQTVQLAFTPEINETAARQGTTQSATITLRSNDTDQTAVTVDISGRSKTPDLQVPNLERYRTLRVGQQTTQTIEVSNSPSATASVDLDSFGVFGVDADEFSVARPTDRTLDPGDSAEIDVTVDPDSAGTKSASLLVTTNDPRQSRESVSLSSSRTVVIVRYGSVTFEYGTNPRSKFVAEDPGTGVFGMNPRLNTVTEFNMTFSNRTPGAGPELGSGVSATPVRYLDIDTDNITPTDHDETAVRFRVSQATIKNLGSVEDGITLYQYDGSSYTPLTTTRVPNNDSRPNGDELAYEATFTNFNDLVIAAGQPDLGLVSDSVTTSGAPDTLESGQNTTVTVSADVENTGSIAGSDTVRVRDSSGNTLNSTTVNVGTGGTPTVPVDVELTGPGSRTLTVAFGAFGGQTQDVTVDIDSPDDGGPPAGGGDDDDAPADEPTDVPAPVEEIGAEPETVESVAPTVRRPDRRGVRDRRYRRRGRTRHHPGHRRGHGHGTRPRHGRVRYRHRARARRRRSDTGHLRP